MSFLSKIGNVLSGGIFSEAKELITDYFPPDMNEQQKAELNIRLEELAQKKQKQIMDAAADAEKTLNQRISQHEGTAKDLLAMPVLGRCVIFLRGVQRPAWGFFTMYLDYVWLTSASSAYTEQQQTALIVINMLVLGFLFGERTIKNLEPLLLKIWGKGQK